MNALFIQAAFFNLDQMEYSYAKEDEEDEARKSNLTLVYMLKISAKVWLTNTTREPKPLESLPR